MSLTVERTVKFGRRHKAAKDPSQTDNDPRKPDFKPGSIPRISKLMALAIRFDRLVREGAVRDYAELARAGCVSRGGCPRSRIC